TSRAHRVFVSLAVAAAGRFGDTHDSHPLRYIHPYSAALRSRPHRRTNGDDRSDVQGPTHFRSSFGLPSGLQQRLCHSHAGSATTLGGSTERNEAARDAGEFFF